MIAFHLRGLILVLGVTGLGLVAPASPLSHAAQPKRAAANANPDHLGRLAEGLAPDRRIVYKRAAGQDLELHVFAPRAPGAAPRPAFVMFHGGGWASGAPARIYPLTDWAARAGMVGISVQYRLYKPAEGRTVINCVEDARSAVRYVRAHASDLGIDPHAIVVSGASAGGHLAVATALFNNFDEAGEDTSVSCRPDALVLISPAVDTSPEGSGNERMGGRWRELSPLLRVAAGMPPTLVFHGTRDRQTPYAGIRAFHEAMLAAGNRCELVIVEDAPHIYMFKDPGLYDDTLQRIAGFLEKLGCLPPSLRRPSPGTQSSRPGNNDNNLRAELSPPFDKWAPGLRNHS